LKSKKRRVDFGSAVETTLQTQILLQKPRESESDKNAKKILTIALLEIKRIKKAAEEQLNLRLLISQTSFTCNKLDIKGV
jgi:hypothetical protein